MNNLFVTFRYLFFSFLFVAFFSQYSFGKKSDLKEETQLTSFDQVHQYLINVDIAPQQKNILEKWLLWFSIKENPSIVGFEKARLFVKSNKHWPDQASLQVKTEGLMSNNIKHGIILDYFQNFPIRTQNGLSIYVNVLEKNDQKKEAQKIVREFWISKKFSAKQQKLFIKKYRKWLRLKDHQSKLEKLLWQKSYKQVLRLLPLVTVHDRSYAKARMALHNNPKRAKQHMRKLPKNLLNSEGLLYDRLRNYRRKDHYQSMVRILKNAPSKLDFPKKWWTERNIAIRWALRKKRYMLAYRLAKSHKQEKGVALAEVEFLAGWIALRKLNNYGAAYKHFSNLYMNVNSPISKARGAYWIARSLEAMGQEEDSEGWYNIASRFSTTFYGQLAHYKLEPNKPLELVKLNEITHTDVKDASFQQFVPLLSILKFLKQKQTARKFFFTALSHAKDKNEFQWLSQYALSLDRKDWAVWAARIAAQSHVYLVPNGYPILEEVKSNKEIDPSLVSGLIRQESNYDHAAISPAGARGLMQLMPKTAKWLSKRLDKKFNLKYLTQDPSYNILLGSTFIQDLVKEFDGSYVFALAAYNAGGSRVYKWQKLFGHPLKNGKSQKHLYTMLDWIEMISFSETRNYVQRVMENIQIYRVLMSENPSEYSIIDDLLR